PEGSHRFAPALKRLAKMFVGSPKFALGSYHATQGVARPAPAKSIDGASASTVGSMLSDAGEPCVTQAPFLTARTKICCELPSRCSKVAHGTWTLPATTVPPATSTRPASWFGSIEFSGSSFTWAPFAGSDTKAAEAGGWRTTGPTSIVTRPEVLSARVIRRLLFRPRGRVPTPDGLVLPLYAQVGTVDDGGPGVGRSAWICPGAGAMPRTIGAVLVLCLLAAPIVRGDDGGDWRDRVTLIASERLRGEFVDWFRPRPRTAAPDAHRYSFIASQLRAGLSVVLPHVQLTLVAQDTRLGHLPDDASLAPPVGNLGPGAVRELDLTLAGAALTLKHLPLAPPADVRLFYLYYRDGRDGVLKVDNRPLPVRTADRAPIAIHTAGGHGVTVVDVGPGRLDLLAWVAVQAGDWGVDDHAAWAYAVETGYQLPTLAAAPWLRVGYDRSSG